MKLITLFLSVCIMPISANMFSQSQKISMSVKNYPLEKVFQEIEKQTNFRFLYRLENVENKTADLNANNSTVEQILDKLLNNQNITYRILENNLVVITPVESRQSSKITGTVVDAVSNEPLPGVNIVVEGTTIGIVTDIDGKYTLDVPSSNAVLVFSYLGYVTERIEVSGRSVIDLGLVPDVKKLDEVVVIGYGTTSKRAVTGSVSKVQSDVFISNTAQNVGTALQGRVSGVQITQNSGNPEADVNIRIRGVSSIYAGSGPLLVVDGVVGGLQLKEINPNDIASIEILKDASAGAIYGSRAANGVVLVTTKTGSKDKSFLNIDYTRGVNTITNWLPIANGTEYLSIMDRAWQNSQADRAGQQFTQFPISGLDGFNRTMAEATNTDWKSYVTQPAHYDQISLSVSGGSEKTRFYLSGQYRDEYGYDAGLRIRRAIFRVNLDHDIAKWLSVGTKLNLNYSFRNNAYASYADYYDKLLPIYPIMSPSDDLSREGRYFYDRNLSGGQGINPLYKRDQTWGDQQQMRDVGDVYIDFKPIKGLVIRSEWGVRANYNRSRDYQSRDFMRKGDGIDPTQEGSIKYSRSETYHYTGTNTITYDKSIAAHGINVMVGNTLENYDSNGQSNTYEGFPTDYFTLTNSNTSIVSTRQGTSTDQYRLVSYMGRFRYDYNKKYFAEVNYRADYSSRFGIDNRWGYFPGMALSWVLSEENFAKKLSFLNFAKIRLSRGKVGNSEVGNYPYVSQVVNWGTYGAQPGFLFNNIGNASIHWEQQLQTNAGIDFTVFKDRVSGSFDYFVKDVTDLIVNDKIGNYHGYYSTQIVKNLGGLTNKGFDISISTKNIVGNFNWTTDFNISRAKSEVTKLSPQQRYIISDKNIVIEGQALGAYYLPVYAGVDPVTGHEMIYAVDPKAAAVRKPFLSDVTETMVDLERTSNNSSHSVILTDKTPYPDFYGGLTNTFAYKGLELACTFTYQYGNYIYDSGIQTLMYTGAEKNVSTDLLKGWTAANPTNIPLIYGSKANIATTRFLYDGSYVRLKNLYLSYTLPKNLLSKMKFQGNLTLKIGGQNLLTFTKYPGIDPEFFTASDNTSANLSPGVAGLNSPQVRTIYFTINATL